MRLTVLSPKVLLDENKLSTDASRNMKEVIDKWFDIFIESGIPIEYFVEDEFTREYLKSRNVKHTIASTHFHDEDIIFRKGMKDTEGLNILSYISDDTLGAWDKSYIRKVDINRKIPIPILRQFRSREDWLQARSDYTIKVHRLRLAQYLKGAPKVVIFRAAKDNMCPSLKDDVKLGDGRLYIEIDVTTGIASAYYGGQWIPADYVKTILSL